MEQNSAQVSPKKNRTWKTLFPEEIQAFVKSFLLSDEPTSLNTEQYQLKIHRDTDGHILVGEYGGLSTELGRYGVLFTTNNGKMSSSRYAFASNLKYPKSLSYLHDGNLMVLGLSKDVDTYFIIFEVVGFTKSPREDSEYALLKLKYYEKSQRPPLYDKANDIVNPNFSKKQIPFLKSAMSYRLINYSLPFSVYVEPFWKRSSAVDGQGIKTHSIVYPIDTCEPEVFADHFEYNGVTPIEIDTPTKLHALIRDTFTSVWSSWTIDNYTGFSNIKGKSPTKLATHDAYLIVRVDLVPNTTNCSVKLMGTLVPKLYPDETLFEYVKDVVFHIETKNLKHFFHSFWSKNAITTFLEGYEDLLSGNTTSITNALRLNGAV